MSSINSTSKEKSAPKGIGEVLLFITAIVWGGGFVAVSKSIDSFGPLYIVAIRFAIASVLISLVFFNKFKEIKKSDIKYGAMIGTFLFGGFALQTAGAAHVTVGKLSFLTALNVIIVPFLAAVVFKEKVKRPYIIAAFIALIGFGFMNLGEGAKFEFGIGEILAIGCAVFFAAHIASLGHFAPKMDPIILSIVQMITCFILGTIGALIFEEPPTNITMDMALPVVYLGVFSSFTAFLCQTIAQKYTSAARTAIILCLEAVFGTALSTILLEEPLTTSMMIGGGLILMAVIGAEYMHAKSETSV